MAIFITVLNTGLTVKNIYTMVFDGFNSFNDSLSVKHKPWIGIIAVNSG